MKPNKLKNKNKIFITSKLSNNALNVVVIKEGIHYGRSILFNVIKEDPDIVKNLALTTLKTLQDLEIVDKNYLI